MKELDYSKSAPPLYVQVYRDLKEQIAGRVYDNGQSIPTETELQALYGVSRITVRQALAALEQEGLVVRVRGKGTMVSRQRVIEERLAGIKSFTEEMRERGMVPGTRAAHCERVTADETLAGIFACPVGAPLWRVRRVRTADSRVIVLFDSYLSGRCSLPLEDAHYHGSLYALLEAQGIYPPAGIRERFEAMVADEALAETLEIAVGDPVMFRTRIALDREQQVLEYTRSYYNAASYAYIVHVGVTEKPGE